MKLPTRRLIFNVIIPLAVWLAWLAIGGWCWSVLTLRELHPHSWPLLVMLMVMAGCGLALIVRAGRALIKRRDRRSTLGALAWGTVPCWLLIAHFGYVYAMTAQRLTQINALTLPMLPIAIVLGQLEVNLRYSQRTEGQRVVMFHHGVNRAEKIVAEADKYLAHLESVLGQPGRTKLHWVRGTLLGRDSFSFGAFSMSIHQAGEMLSHLDRHELAHAAINQHFTAASRPPMLLVEGWAEAIAAKPADNLYFQAAREAPWTPSISELVGPSWAWIDAGPVYTQGAAFVSQLLRDHGGQKFLKLYLTCQPQTMDADCRRILGTSLATLQQDHARRLSEWTTGRRLRRLLGALKLARNIDKAAWLKFVDAYAAAADNSDLPVEYEANLTTAHNFAAIAGQNTPQVTKSQGRVVVSPEIRLMTSDEQILAVTRRTAFELRRLDADHPWKLSNPWSPFPEVNRWYHRHNFAALWSDSMRQTFDSHRTWNWERNPPRLVELVRDKDPANLVVEIALQLGPGPEGAHDGTLRLKFSPAANWREVYSLESRQAWGGDTAESQSRHEYKNGKLVGLQWDHHVTTGAGKTKSSSISNYEIRPLKTPTAEITPLSFGLSVPANAHGSIVTWPITACLAVAALQMVIGSILAYDFATPAWACFESNSNVIPAKHLADWPDDL